MKELNKEEIELQLMEKLETMSSDDGVKVLLTMWKHEKTLELENEKLETQIALKELDIEGKKADLESKEKIREKELEVEKYKIDISAEVQKEDSALRTQEASASNKTAIIAAIAGVLTGGLTTGLKFGYDNHKTNKILKFRESDIISPIDQKMIGV